MTRLQLELFYSVLSWNYSLQKPWCKVCRQVDHEGLSQANFLVEFLLLWAYLWPNSFLEAFGNCTQKIQFHCHEWWLQDEDNNKIKLCLIISCIFGTHVKHDMSSLEQYVVLLQKLHETHHCLQFKFSILLTSWLILACSYSAILKTLFRFSFKMQNQNASLKTLSNESITWMSFGWAGVAWLKILVIMSIERR